MSEATPAFAPPLSEALLDATHVVAEVLGGRNLDAALAGHRFANRAAVLDLAYPTLRDYGRGDFILAQLMPRTPSPMLRALLLVALARLAVRVQDVHTTVDQAVRAASRLEAGRYKAVVNAVLRNALRQQAALETAIAADEQAYWRHPRWWLRRLRQDHPRHWQAVASAGNSHPPMSLRVNLRRNTVEAALAALRQAGIEARRSGAVALTLERPVPVDKLPGFAAGLLSVQDAGAQQAAAWLDLRDGQRVLDACAAPGGKAAHMLESADVDLLALDADVTRAARIDENLARLGLSATVKVADCRAVDAWWDGRPFQRILADVPCSASGVVRRHPDAKWLRRDTDIAGFARQQAEIIDALWRVLAPGGKMLYATCSVFAEENHQQIAAFLSRHPDSETLPIDDGSALQLLPSADHDGFFYALLGKRA